MRTKGNLNIRAKKMQLRWYTTTITLTKSPPADDDDANSIDGRFSSFRSSELRVLSHKKSNAASIWGSFFFSEKSRNLYGHVELFTL